MVRPYWRQCGDTAIWTCPDQGLPGQLGYTSQNRQFQYRAHCTVHCFQARWGAQPPAQKLRFIRALVSKRAQLVETRKQHLAQIKAQGKLRSADMFEAT